MGLLDKRAADLTPRDAVEVWSWTGIWDLIQILLVVPLFFRKSQPTPTIAELEEANRQCRREARSSSILSGR